MGVIGVLVGPNGVLMGVLGGVTGVPMAAMGIWTAMGQPSRCRESGGGLGRSWGGSLGSWGGYGGPNGVLMGVMGDLGLLWGHGPPWGSPAAAVSLGGVLMGVIGVLIGS